MRLGEIGRRPTLSQQSRSRNRVPTAKDQSYGMNLANLGSRKQGGDFVEIGSSLHRVPKLATPLGPARSGPL